MNIVHPLSRPVSLSLSLILSRFLLLPLDRSCGSCNCHRPSRLPTSPLRSSSGHGNRAVEWTLMKTQTQRGSGSNKIIKQKSMRRWVELVVVGTNDAPSSVLALRALTASLQVGERLGERGLARRTNVHLIATSFLPMILELVQPRESQKSQSSRAMIFLER